MENDWFNYCVGRQPAALLSIFEAGECVLVVGSLPLITGENLFFWKTLMLSRLIVALFVVVNGSKWLFGNKRLQTPELVKGVCIFRTVASKSYVVTVMVGYSL